MKCFINMIAIALAIDLALACVVPLSEEQEAKLEAWKPDDKKYLWELSGQFEGDIVLTEEQERNGAINTRWRWLNKTLVYDFDELVSAEHQEKVTNELQYFNDNTCLTVKRRTNEEDFVLVNTSTSGCWSFLGRIGGQQSLSLGKNCVTTSIILHEFLHAFGFYHMQSAYDQADYVEIFFENIQEGYENQFTPRDNDTVSHFGQKYDLKSVMHYSEYAFSSNGNRTIRALDGTSPLGNYEGLTETDRLKLMAMYEC